MTAKFTEPRAKVLGVPLQKAMQKADDGTLIVRGYFTSDRKDEVGDIITRAATERAIPRYRQWSNIRYMHMPRPVAKVVRMGTADGLEWNECEIKVIDPQTVFEVENGLLPALSVGILINPDDIDLLEDGGWIINSYSLAEISLVDHPANYDARLKDLPVDQGLRMMARTYGMDCLARSMANLLERELAMDKQIKDVTGDAVETVPVEEPEITKAEAPADGEGEPKKECQDEDGNPMECPPEDDGGDKAIEAEVEKSIDAEAAPAAEEPVAEEAPATEEAPVEEEKSATPTEDDRLKSLEEGFRSLAEAIASLTTTVKALVEAPKADEQTVGDAESEEKAAAPTEEAQEAEPVEEVGTPTDRKGALPETELPDGKEEAQKSQPVTDLRQALSKYFSARK